MSEMSPRETDPTRSPVPTKESIGRMRSVIYWSFGVAVIFAGYYLTRVLRSSDVID